MKFVVDEQIPFVRGILEPFAEVSYLPGEQIWPAAVRDAHAILVRTRTRCDAALLGQSRVQLVATATIGFDHIDIDYCHRRGIEVCTAAGCNARGVAQWVFAALQALGFRGPMGTQGSGRTLGIIGMGHVGSVVREVAAGAGCSTLCCDPPRRARAEAGTADFVAQAELLAHSDIVTLHVPLDASTRGLVDTAFLGQLKPGAWLLNSSRGEVIDEQALKTAIRDNRLTKTALDVWCHEPRIDRELLELSTLATPHIAGYTQQGKAMATAMAVRAIARHFGLPIAADWYPAEAAGQTPRQNLSWEAIAAGMPAHYPILRDDQALRRDPAAFETLRGGYPLRDEFF